MTARTDIVVVGCGAAGLFACIFAARSLRTTSEMSTVLGVDGAKSLGAKVLVAGGGRCNVTHHRVDETAYAGASPAAIRKVLRKFDVAQTVEFFAQQGVQLKQEETGKLFPTTDDAHTVLNALRTAADEAGVALRYPLRVARITKEGDGFLVHPDGEADALLARRVVLATGGKSLPKTGSDGLGHELAQSLGHSITPRVFPSLVPLTLAQGSLMRELSGLTLDTTVEVRSASGKRLKAFTNSMLCTHFGLSGPGVLDISRYYIDAVAEAKARGDDAPSLVINWLPGHTAETLDVLVIDRARKPQAPGIGRLLCEHLPERLVRQLCNEAGVDFSLLISGMTRAQRRAICMGVTQTPAPVTGDRGYLFAEVTAGGVPLSEIDLDTMESRVCPGLHLCGEICDVDGRIGGFNFQWAWSSGYVAGCGAAHGVCGVDRDGARQKGSKS